MNITCTAFNSGAAMHALCRVQGLSPAEFRIAAQLITLTEWSESNPFAARGEARIGVTRLAELAEITRQYCHRILGSLQDKIGLVVVGHSRANGSRTINGYRFAWLDAALAPAAPRHPEMTADAAIAAKPSTGGDTLPRKDSFQEYISVDDEISVQDDTTAFADNRVARTIAEAKKHLPGICRLDSTFLWRSFCQFNRKRGHARVPLRWLVGFLRKWRGGMVDGAPEKRHGAEQTSVVADASARIVRERSDAAEISEADRIAQAAPWANNHFHERDLCAVIGRDAYQERIAQLTDKYSVTPWRARMIAHGEAIIARQISA